MNIEPVRRILDNMSAPYALIGARAMAARGYPRFTVDIDLLTSDLRVLDPHIWADLERTGATVERRRGEHDDPLAGVVHILLPDGTDVDIVVARWKWESELLTRCEVLTIGEGVHLPVPRTSDLILLKLAAGGFADLQDAAALLATGNRDAIAREVELRIDDVRPDVRAAWRSLVA